MDPASSRFRQDLAVSPTEANGGPGVDVSDAKTGTSFRFYDFEYRLALQLNGQPVEQVIAWASMTFGVDLTAEGIGEFTGRLLELGFLEAGAAAAVSGTLPAAELAEPDSAADEWMSPQGAKTAQFDPDPAMLAGSFDASPDRTPVASLDHPMEMDEGPKTEPTMPAVLADHPPHAARPVAPAPVVPAPAAPTSPASMTESAKSRWALELDGALQAPDSPAAVTAPAQAGGQIALPPRPVASPTPAGISEPRQPPAPESVVMTGFSDVTAKRTDARSSGPE